MLYEFLYPRISSHPMPCTQSPNFFFISAPYYKGLSEALSLRLNKFNIFLAHVPTTSIRSLIFNFKFVFTPLDSIGIAYKIPCLDCDSIYIGQSGRSLHVRIDEHRSACKSQDLRSKIFHHSINLDHR